MRQTWRGYSLALTRIKPTALTHPVILAASEKDFWRQYSEEYGGEDPDFWEDMKACVESEGYRLVRVRVVEEE